jgi:predicted nuclease of restriction endonuclease-like (RecB) superfamily
MSKPIQNSDFEKIVLLIEKARSRAFSKVNAELVLLYFNVGKIVSIKVANGVWGEGTVNELANYIGERMPSLSGFNRRGLYRMKQFYEVYSDPQFISPLVTQLEAYFAGNGEEIKVSAVPTLLKSSKRRNKKVSALPTQVINFEEIKAKIVSSILTKIVWSNHLEILSQTKSPEEKFFYLLHCIKEKWSMRELRRQLSTGYFERAMLSKIAISPSLKQIPSGIFKEPYIFEFLDLPDLHSENDLEKALIKNLQKFIIEIGKGFSYMGNQFRLQVGNKDYYTDLLFYHRDLQCLVLFELKIEEFQPEFLGKLNFYLEALDRDVKRPNEKPSIGILLCKGKDTEVVEYAMARNTSPAMIADYETKLISKKVLADKLHQLVERLSKEEIDQ